MKIIDNITSLDRITYNKGNVTIYIYKEEDLARASGNNGEFAYGTYKNVCIKVGEGLSKSSVLVMHESDLVDLVDLLKELENVL